MMDPVHPFEDGKINGLCVMPWPPALDHLGLEQAVDCFKKTV